ncbi:MAG: O-antigen ligase family protein, partial [Clostridia bacterium]|nr:O-antigen ligase family protein [Clostridia bacterium]
AFVALLFAGIIFSLARFKRDFSLLHPKRVKGFHASLVALIIPFAFAGVTKPAENAVARIAALALIILIAAGYTFFVLTITDEKEKKGLAEYVIKILFCMGVCIVVQLFYYYLTNFHTWEELKAAIMYKNVNLGWAGPNNVAPTLSLAIPATLYLCIKKNKVVPLLVFIALLEYALMICAGSRGAILFTTMALPFMLLYVMGKTENKALFAGSCGVLFVVSFALIVYFGEQVSDIITNMLSRGFDSSGRTEELYPEAFEIFKQFPIFGAGWDHNLGGLANDNYTPYWYHSTALQVLADMGVVGVITFVFFYFHRYRTFFVLRKKPQAVALFFSLALFDAYGMIDTNFFGPTFFIMLLVISIAVEVDLPENKCRAFGGRDPISDCKALFAKLTKKKGRKETDDALVEAENAIDLQEQTLAETDYCQPATTNREQQPAGHEETARETAQEPLSPTSQEE